MKFVIGTLALVSINSFSGEIISRPIESSLEINTVCQKNCNFIEEISAFKKIYKGNAIGKTVNFINSRSGSISFSVPIEDVYSYQDYGTLNLTDQDQSVGLMDAGLDCFYNSKEPWCTDGWNNSPEWEDYRIAIQEHLFNSRIEIIVDQRFLDNMKDGQSFLWSVLTAVPASRITSTILKMIEKYGVAYVNKTAAESLAGGTISYLFGKLASVKYKIGDIILIENGKSKLIRDGVVIEEHEIIPPDTTYTSNVYGYVGEGYYAPWWAQNSSNGTFCFSRTFGTVTTGGGVTFWVSYQPCATGIYEP